MTPTVEYPAAIASGAGPPMTSRSVTSQQYFPKPSATMSDSSMKCAVPLGSPVVPEVNRRTETSIRSRCTASHRSGFFMRSA